MAKTERTGMFAKDKLFGIDRLDETVELGEHFVVLGVGQRSDTINLTNDKTGEVTTVIPTWLMIQRYDTGMDDTLADVQIVQTIASSIFANAGEAMPDEFPAVCNTAKVPNKQAGYSDAYVLNFVKPFEGKTAKPEAWPNIPATVNGAAMDGRMWEDGKLLN